VNIDGAHDAPPAGGPVKQARDWLARLGAPGPDVEPTPIAAEPVPATTSAATTSAATTGPTATSRRQSDGEPDADPETVARTIALRRLTARARTRSELEAALTSRQVPADVAERVLDRLAEVGLVDDRMFAQDWVRSRQARRGLSRSALRRELQAKGVDRELIDEALAPVAPEEELAAARAVAEKKLRSMQELDRAVRYRRLAAALSRRGFGPGVVAAVLDEVL
jgi:regulatory protein